MKEGVRVTILRVSHTKKEEWGSSWFGQRKQQERKRKKQEKTRNINGFTEL